MAPSSRHLYPAWLRPGPTRGPAGGTDSDRRPEWTSRVWERLRDFDRRYATAVDVTLAVALFVLCSGWFVERAVQPSLVLVAALVAPLVFRRRAPMTVFLVVAAVASVQWLVTGPALADTALLVAIYTVALESDWVLVAVAAVILEVGVIMATVHWRPTGNRFDGFFFLTGLALAALLAGVVVRALRSQLDWLDERAERLRVERDQQASLAAAAERARIAREMHDMVSHNIQVMVTLADAATAAQATDPERAAEVMEEVSTTGRQALTDMRRMLGVLRDDRVQSSPTNGASPNGASPKGNPLDGNGRPTLAPQPGLRDLDSLVERVGGTGLPVHVERRGRPFEVSGAAGLTVYRIVQEALTNALKHAEQPATVEVLLSFDDPDVTVRVTDDGRPPVSVAHTNGTRDPVGGRDRNTETRHGVTSTVGGHGVAGMAERAAAFGGRLEAGPRPDGGWEVCATLRDCKAPAPA